MGWWRGMGELGGGGELPPMCQTMICSISRSFTTGGGEAGGREGLEGGVPHTGMLWNLGCGRNPPPSFPVSSRKWQHVTQAGLRTQKRRLSGSACKTSGHSLFYCFAVQGPVVSGMRTLMTTRSGKTLFERNYLRSCCPFGMLLLEAAPLIRGRWPGESPPTPKPLQSKESLLPWDNI